MRENWEPFKFIGSLSFRGIISKLSGTKMSTPSLSKHGKPSTKQPKQNVPVAESKLHEEPKMTFHEWSFVYKRGEVAYPCLLRSHELRAPSLLAAFRFWGRKRPDLWASERDRVPPPPHPPTPFVSALLGSLVTAEWSPHYCEELACNFHHSISFQCRANNKRQHRTPPRTCMGLLEQEGNVRGQIKSGVGLSAAWVTAPSGPEPPSPPP